MPIGFKDLACRFQRLCVHVWYNHLLQDAQRAHWTYLYWIEFENTTCGSKKKKCEFFKTEIDSLGHTISAGVLKPSRNKCIALFQNSRPGSLTQVFKSSTKFTTPDSLNLTDSSLDCFEMYNDTPYDLLAVTSNKANIKINGINCHFLDGLTYIPVVNKIEAMGLIKYAWHHLSIVVNMINANSSRSHAVFGFKFMQIYTLNSSQLVSPTPQPTQYSSPPLNYTII